ncbi:hypothetical protein GCM10027586_07950 [Kineococcus gypseus]
MLIEAFGARAHPPEQRDALFAGGWPAWIDADALAAQHLPAVRAVFADLQVALLMDERTTQDGAAQDRTTHDPAQDRAHDRAAFDSAGEVLTAAAWGVPIRWNGTVADLPAGYSETLARAVADHAVGAAVDTLVICAAQVRADATGRGLAARVLHAVIDAGAARGLHRVIALLRPTGKHEHPAMGIEQYARWRQPDGQAVDAWVRTHERMGAHVLATTPASQVFEAGVQQWRSWSGLAMPTSGTYVVAGAPDVVHIDLDADIGRLSEPGIWVQHR